MARPARPEPKVFLSDRARRPRAGLVPRDLLRARDARAAVLGEKSTSYLEDAEAADRAPRDARGRPLIVVQLRDPVRAGRVATGGSAPSNGLEDAPARDGARENLDGPRAVGPGRHVGLAVRLPGAGPLRRLPRSRGWPRSPTTSTVRVPRGPAGPGRGTSVRLCTSTLGVDAGTSGRATPGAGQREHGADPRARRRTCSRRLRDVLPRERPGAEPSSRTAAALAAGTADHPGVTVTDQHEHPELPEIPFNKTAIEGRELEYVQQSHPERPHRPPAGSSRRAPRCCWPRNRRRGGAADDLVHGGARAVRAAARPPPGRHRRSCRRSRSRPPRSPSPRQGARLLFCDIEPRHPRARPGAPRDAARRLACARSWSSTTPASPATWTGIRAVLADRPDVALIEDNAHGLFGTLARAAARQPRAGSRRLSFHETKNFICGEGGALLVNDPATSTGRGCSTTRAPTGGRSCSARSTSTPGRTPARRSGSSDVLAAYLLRPARAARRRSRPSGAASTSATPRLLAPHADELGVRRCRCVPADCELGVPHVLRAAARP